MPNDDAMERAREHITKFYGPSWATSTYEGKSRAEHLAQALTETRDAALEEAAGIADLYRSSSGSFIASEIRRAKSTEKL